MVESTPSRQRRPPCKTNKEESDEAADAAALTYLHTLRYILPWFEAQLPIGFEYEPRGFNHFGLVFDQNLRSFENGVLVRIELRGAIVQLARKTKMA